MILTFVLPLPPNLANSRMHWRKRHREHSRYRDHLDMLLAMRQLPPVPREPWARAQVTAVLALHNPMDDDNAVARCKWPLDWIVSRGYLTDDRRTALRWASFPTQEIRRKQDPTLTLTLERVP